MLNLSFLKGRENIILLAIILLAIPLTVGLSLQRQILQKKAAEPEKPTTATVKKFTVAPSQLLKQIDMFDIKKSEGLDNNSLLAIAERRAKAMEQLMEQKPEIALRVAVSQNIAKSLPSNVQSFIEKEESLEGNLRVVHGDDFSENKSQRALFLEQGENRVQLFVTDPTKPIVPSSRVRVTGLRLNNAMAVDTQKNPIQQLSQPTEGEQVQAVTTVRKVLALIVNFQNDLRQPDPVIVKQNIFTARRSANAYMKEVSYNQLVLQGKLRTDGDVVGPMTMPIDNTIPSGKNCSDMLYVWATTAMNTAQSQGINLTGYQNIVFVMPPIPTCSAGFAEVPGKYVWILGFYDPGVFTHEIGHTLGTMHANALECTKNGQRVVIGNNCVSKELADPFDLMGYPDFVNNGRHMSLYHKAQSGWLLNPNNTKTVTANGTFLIEPMEFATNGIKSLKIRRDATTSIFIEYRRPYGLFDNFATTDPVTKGVSIRIADSDYLTRNITNLVDVTSSSDLKDPALLLNNTFFDPVSGVTIKNIATTTTNVKVQVTLAAPTCVQNAPAMSITPATQTSNPGELKLYHVTVTNNDSAGCDPIDISYDVVAADILTFAPASAIKAVQPSSTDTFDVAVSSSSSISPGDYQFYVTAKRTNGNMIGQVTGTYTVASQNPTPTPTITQ